MGYRKNRERKKPAEREKTEIYLCEEARRHKEEKVQDGLFSVVREVGGTQIPQKQMKNTYQSSIGRIRAQGRDPRKRERDEENQSSIAYLKMNEIERIRALCFLLHLLGPSNVIEKRSTILISQDRSSIARIRAKEELNKP
ncbi:hypothetical protein AMTR_s00067p00191510 [Amborella trichopoda]|uniref:Uncharacterized protein n=1 Tax=Amborella trichopoda TaxID=13333 RepID=U5DEV0_AMBTC|nr:hypothetical protein AMTR_s00067p00191510 [Amborella trichopoda]